MALIVQKYGGTSVGSVERIRNVARRVARYHREGHQLVVVVSAMSGETNRLLALAKELAPEPNPRELDVVAATGEQVTIGLLAIALEAVGLKAKSYTGGQIRVLTDSAFTKARILSIDEDRIRADLDAGTIVVVAGFQGVDADGNITTLGRGGSDTSGVALAAALSADECQIYTDVDGVYTTDPRIVPEARRLDTVTFEEMLEMASLGSKVLQIRSVEFAGKYNVKLRVLSSFEDPESTSQARSSRSRKTRPWSRPSFRHRVQSRRSQDFADGRRGPAGHRLQHRRADRRRQRRRRHDRAEHRRVRSHRLLVHGEPERIPEGARCARVGARQAFKAREIIGDNRICKVSVVGIGMRSHVGIASRMFKALADEASTSR
jgi:aspartate kinase